jgi:CBS domain-containing protein
METDLFTVHADDLIEMVAQLMDWRKIRHMPVEDTKGHLIGLITARSMLRYYTNDQTVKGEQVVSAKEIMVANPLTINPKATIVEAMRVMRENRVGCLPVVVANNELIGIITEMDFVRISGRLIERLGEQETEALEKAKKTKKK